MVLDRPASRMHTDERLRMLNRDAGNQSNERARLKVALYARVSLDEGKDDRRYQEPENQLVPLREWAKNQDWEIFGEFVDRASGADPNRPEFRRLLQAAMMRQFTCIVVWRLDRFSRETMSQVVGRIQRLRERGVAVKSFGEAWLDTSAENPMGELVLAVMAWAASEERRKISDRTRAGIRQRRAIGQWRGGRPRKVLPPTVVQMGDSKEKGRFSDA